MIENEQMITIGIVGEPQVGKTMFINKFIKKLPTIAIQIDYGIYELQQGTKIRIKIWDTSGQNKYKQAVSYHLKGADIIIIMYDITDYLSFYRVKDWVKLLKKQNIWVQNILIIGNKVDLIQIDNCLRKVKIQDIQKLSQQLNVKYCQLSVKEDETANCLNEIIQNVLNQRVESQLKKKENYLISSQQKNQKQSVCQCVIF